MPIQIDPDPGLLPRQNPKDDFLSQLKEFAIDWEGKVAYKSGCGPFGFKAGEMEQALVMTLLDQT